MPRKQSILPVIGICTAFLVMLVVSHLLKIKNLPPAEAFGASDADLLRHSLVGTLLSFLFLSFLWIYIEVRLLLLSSRLQSSPHRVKSNDSSLQTQIDNLKRQQHFLLLSIPIGLGVITILLAIGIGVISWLLTRVP